MKRLTAAQLILHPFLDISSVTIKTMNLNTYLKPVDEKEKVKRPFYSSLKLLVNLNI